MAPRYIGPADEREDFTSEFVGAEYFESDTGLTYVFCGVTENKNGGDNGDEDEAVWTLKLYPVEKEAT